MMKILLLLAILCNKSINTQLSSSRDSDFGFTWFTSIISKSSSDGKYYYRCHDRDIADRYIGFYAVSWYF